MVRSGWVVGDDRQRYKKTGYPTFRRKSDLSSQVALAKEFHAIGADSPAGSALAAE